MESDCRIPWWIWHKVYQVYQFSLNIHESDYDSFTKCVQYRHNGLKTDGSFTVDNSNEGVAQTTLFKKKKKKKKKKTFHTRTTEVLLYMIETVFVCVEVLRPSQPNGVMSSAVSLPNHTFTGQA